MESLTEDKSPYSTGLGFMEFLLGWLVGWLVGWWVG